MVLIVFKLEAKQFIQVDQTYLLIPLASIFMIINMKMSQVVMTMLFYNTAMMINNNLFIKIRTNSFIDQEFDYLKFNFMM